MVSNQSKRNKNKLFYQQLSLKCHLKTIQHQPATYSKPSKLKDEQRNRHPKNVSKSQRFRHHLIFKSGLISPTIHLQLFNKSNEQPIFIQQFWADDTTILDRKNNTCGLKFNKYGQTFQQF